MAEAERDPSPEERRALAGEIIGASVRLTHPGTGALPVEGTIVDETLNLLVIRDRATGRTRRIAKSGASGTILLGERQLPLRGDLLRVRPEDRTKRLSLRGRRRLR